jgi:hypothetical protein
MIRELLREYIETILTEGGEGGAKYELQVFNAIKAAHASGNMTHTAGFDANLPDADITINGEVYNVEVKLNGGAQMGGGSIGWDSGEFFAAGHDIEAMQPIVDTLNSSDELKEINAAIQDFVGFLSKHRGRAGKVITGFPVSGASKDAWEAAVKKGLLIPINRKVDSSVDFIAQHYAKKGTNYIQIGGQGLFYLAKNPAKLPIPKLTGRVQLEIRASRAGSAGKPVVGAGLRVQPRLRITEQSPYTLDDPKSIREMLSAVKGR